MNATRTIAASIALAAAMGAALTANAGTVHDSFSKSDPRYMTTGCRFAGAFPSGAGSIGIWIKNVTAYDTPACVFGSCHVNAQTSNDQGLLLFIDGATGNFGFRVAGSKDGAVSRKEITAAGTSSKLNDGCWHFLLGTFDKTSGKMNLYIDGESAGSADIDIESLSFSRCLAISAVGTEDESTSRQRADYGAAFKGLYAEATLWNKALSAEEAATLHTRRAYPLEDGLIGYWPLADERDLAQDAIRRANNSRPDALFYVSQTVDDTGFFDNPPNLFLASAEWSTHRGYEQPAGATFKTLDDPATNVADAVSAAIAGNAIFLMPGTHSITSQIDITKANLTLTGRYLGNDFGEAVVDAQGRSRHFRSSSDKSGTAGWVFDGLTFVNGKGDNGGSLHFKSKTGIVRNCVFRDNLATANGGAIFSQIANGTVVSNCVFTGNSTSGLGGAIYTQQNLDSAGDRCFVLDCIVTNNTAQQGGGVYASKCVQMARCLFMDNSTSGSDRRGGHISVGKYSNVAECYFTGRCSATYGICIDMTASNVAVTNCNFSGLEPSGSYGIVHINNVAGCTFSDSVVTNTSIPSGMTMFHPERSGASLLVRQCIFDSSVTRLVTDDRGGKTRFENCTILSSEFDIKHDSSAQNVLVNCIAPYADITSSGAFVNIVTNSLVKSVSGGTQDSRVMTGDPKFVDAANGDYRLSATSPCREKGIVLDWMTADATDIDGNPRLANLLGKVAADALPDLGCYECQEKGLVPTVMSFR